jgi:hypothetical protein
MPDNLTRHPEQQRHSSKKVRKTAGHASRSLLTRVRASSRLIPQPSATPERLIHPSLLALDLINLLHTLLA